MQAANKAAITRRLSDNDIFIITVRDIVLALMAL